MPPVRTRRRGIAPPAPEPSQPAAAERTIVGGLPLGVGLEPSPTLARRVVVPGLSLEAGVYANLVVPPGCLKDQCLLRTSCSAAHTSEQVREAVAIFSEVGTRLGFLPVAIAT